MAMVMCCIILRRIYISIKHKAEIWRKFEKKNMIILEVEKSVQIIRGNVMSILVMILYIHTCSSWPSQYLQHFNIQGTCYTNQTKKRTKAFLRMARCVIKIRISGYFGGSCNTTTLPTSSISSRIHIGSNRRELLDAMIRTIVSARANLPLERSHLTDSGTIL